MQLAKNFDKHRKNTEIVNPEEFYKNDPDARAEYEEDCQEITDVIQKVKRDQPAFYYWMLEQAAIQNITFNQYITNVIIEHIEAYKRKQEMTGK